MSKQFNEVTDDKIILMGRIKYYYTALQNQTERADALNRMLLRNIVTSQDKQQLLDYIELENPYAYLNSELINEKTVIKQYTNKKGVTFRAHYTVNDNYLCRVTEDDDKPRYYEGNFRVQDYLNILDIVFTKESAELVKKLFNKSELFSLLLTQKTKTKRTRPIVSK